MMSIAKLNPLIVHPGKASVYDHIGGEKITILLSAKDTGGALAMFIDDIPPGGGPPRHIHHNEDETFYILEGELEMQVNEDMFTARPGTSVFLPRGIPHTFGNLGTQPVKTLTLLTPAGLEEFFAEIEPLVIQNEPDMTAVVAVASKYGIEVVGLPLTAKEQA
jgi:quercetin dioxygenase-like cupin family protein